MNLDTETVILPDHVLQTKLWTKSWTSIPTETCMKLICELKSDVSKLCYEKYFFQIRIQTIFSQYWPEVRIPFYIPFAIV